MPNRLGWLLLALALAAGCGRPGEQANVPVPKKVAVGGATGQELAAEQILRKGNGTEPETLDPHRAEGVTASNVLRDLFEGLISEAPDGTLIPGAAESWTVSDDGRVYTFRLRGNGRWSNGDRGGGDGRRRGDWLGRAKPELFHHGAEHSHMSTSFRFLK